MKPYKQCPKCDKRLVLKKEWVPSVGFTGKTLYTHIHSLGDLGSDMCTYIEYIK